MPPNRGLSQKGSRAVFRFSRQYMPESFASMPHRHLLDNCTFGTYRFFLRNVIVADSANYIIFLSSLVNVANGQVGF